MIANLLYAATGEKIPARFDGLAERRVAVVCVESQGGYGSSIVAQQLNEGISTLLAKNVPEIEIIESQKVSDWIDQHDWDYFDFQAVGKGVGAESVVAVNIDSFSLHEGATMYKGRANVSMAVYDMLQGGKQVYQATPPQIQYPVNAGYHAAEMEEKDFRKYFLATLSHQISRHFYQYDAIENFAQDTTLVGRP
jgi:hypothetical protein